MNTQQTPENDDIESTARHAAEDGENVREQVRKVTLDALTQGTLDAERIKEVVHSVIAGVSQGVSAAGGSGSDAEDSAKKTLEEALKGVDEALKKSAEAVELSLQEAAGKADDFAHSELKKAIEEMKALEEMFLDTIRKVAQGADDLVRNVLQDLIAHARRTGTDVGRAAKQTTNTLQTRLPQAAQQSAKAAVTAGENMGRQLAQVASGILSGLASGIDRAISKDQKPQDKP